MGKILFTGLLRHLLTALIAFLVAKHVLAAGVAERLNRGDTVELWNSGYSVSVTDAVNYLSVVLPAVLLPVLLGAWGKIKTKYALLVARLTPQKMSAREVNAVVASTSPVQIIKAVAQNPS